MSDLNVSNKENRRKNFLIHPSFQKSFLRHILFLNFIICSIFYSAQCYFFWKLSDLGRSAGFPEDHVFFKFVEAQRGSLNFIFILTVMIVSSLLMVLALFYSHKIAGPLCRLHQYMMDFANGKVSSPLHFRKSDYFVELADSTNTCLKNKEPKS